MVVLRVVMLVGEEIPFAESWARAAACHAEVITVTAIRKRAGAPRDDAEMGRVRAGDYTVQCLRLRPKRLLGWLINRVMARRLARCVHRIEQERGPVDLIHTHFYSSLGPMPALKRRTGIPYVVTEHSSRLTLKSATHKPLTRRGLRIARRGYREAARVIAVSNYLKNCITRLGLPARIVVIGNPVDVSLFRPAEGPGGEGLIRIVSVGRLESDKDPLFLLEAFRIAWEGEPRLRLEFIGDGPERNAVLRAIEVNGLQDIVTLRGTVSQEEVAARLRQADAFALGSRVETFCLAAAEAVAAGVPVVMPWVEPMPELIDELSGILVPSRDVHQMAEALLDISSPDVTFDKRRMASSISSRFSRRAIGARLLEMYQSILEEGTDVRVRPPAGVG